MNHKLLKSVYIATVLLQYCSPYFFFGGVQFHLTTPTALARPKDLLTKSFVARFAVLSCLPNFKDRCILQSLQLFHAYQGSHQRSPLSRTNHPLLIELSFRPHEQFDILTQSFRKIRSFLTKKSIDLCDLLYLSEFINKCYSIASKICM